MIGSVHFLLFTVLIADAVHSEVLSASNVQTCKDLCVSCSGTSTFDNNICNCHVPDNDEKATECMRHILKKQIEKSKLPLPSSQEFANRGTRCSKNPLVKAKKRIRSGDVDRVVNYFVSGGPITGVSPLVGSAQANCETKSSVDNKTEVAPLSEEAKLAEGRSASEENTVKPIVTETKIVTTSKPSEEIDDEDVHTIEPRSFLHHHRRFLNALPRALLGIPQALVSAVAPLAGAPYPEIVSAPQSQHHSGLHNPHLLGAVAPLQYGLYNDHAVPAHILATNPKHTDASLQDQLINPYLGMVNPLLVAAQRTYPHRSFSRSSPFVPVLELINPEFYNKKQDGTQTTDEKVTPLDVTKSSQSTQKSDEKPSLLHQAIIQQNAILESLSEQLRNYSPSLGAPQSQQTSIQPSSGTPESMKPCYCPAQEPKVGSMKDIFPQTSDRLARLRTKNARSLEASTPAAKPEPTKPTLKQKTKSIGVTMNSPTEQPKENSDSTTPISKVPRRSREPVVNLQENHWQYLPQYLNQLPENVYFTYRKKRTSVKHSDEEKTNVA
ncbi:uncharacterized protein [Venturia canescens]|uniref:uncharacterized protein n=1 Tax=Venturia canescens TaxID=32260 RepID=UPI001C9C73D2|nr:uncharacterized protein LOC122417970 [Venturia canescens]XP_043287872.1 uncharacterized protein LOC122417970 [Venturia canescens]